ncbi:MAG TPA: HDIG domain-containing protein [Candidatus Prevotella stercoripullorum]|nr:HDIG domain-containing protein [Candidatus Prevotella stercoripullorum]
MDYNLIIQKYYNGNPELLKILLKHSKAVADKAIAIAEAHPELPIDRQFLLEAAMVHDIGIIKTNAPDIQCFGTEPYIRHGVLGAEMMRAEGYPLHARVCERHTGAGLSLNEIEEQSLPLPHEDLLPETLEEKLICYADKFFSKTRLDREKTLEQAERSVAKHGEEGLRRFKEMEEIFG